MNYRINVLTESRRDVADTSVEAYMGDSQELTIGKQSLRLFLDHTKRVSLGMEDLLKKYIECTHLYFNTEEDREFYWANKELYKTAIEKEDETRTDEEKALIEAFELIEFEERTEYNEYLEQLGIYPQSLRDRIMDETDSLTMENLIADIKRFRELNREMAALSDNLNTIGLFGV